LGRHMKLHPVSRLKKSRDNSRASLGVRLGLSVLLVLVLLTFTAWPVHAFKDEPWSKDYKSWTNEDVQKILYESPWVKMVEMGAPWLKGPTHFLTPLPMDCNGRPDMTKDRTPASWAMGNTESIVIFQVTWQSARTIRAAKLRQSSLCGKEESERGEEMLEDQPEQYVIVVNSPDMTPFDGMDEDALLKNTSLQSKKTQKKIGPESVSIQRYGKTVRSLTFKFPRKTDTGEPLISPDDREIEFVAQSGKFNMKAKFQPPKMVGKNGLDL
jgi:hypothetical protein